MFIFYASYGDRLNTTHLKSHKFHKMLQDIIGSHAGFHRMSLDVIGFHWISICLIGFQLFQLNINMKFHELLYVSHNSDGFHIISLISQNLYEFHLLSMDFFSTSTNVIKLTYCTAQVPYMDSIQFLWISNGFD